MNRRNSSREGSAKTDPSLYFPHISRVESLREFLSPESFFGFLSLSPVGAASRSCLRCGNSRGDLSTGIIPAPQQVALGDGAFRMPSTLLFATNLEGQAKADLEAWMRRSGKGNAASSRLPPAAHSPSATLRGTTAQLSRLVMNICSWLMISSWIRGTASTPHSS